jgi:hypothetical protein
MFVLLGELFGGLIYHYTLGVLVLGAARRIIDAIKAVFSFIKRKILLPAWSLFLSLAAMYVRPCVYLLKKFKKYLQKTKIRLKNERKLLYNHIKRGLSLRKAKLKARKLAKAEQKGKTHEKKAKKKTNKKTR